VRKPLALIDIHVHILPGVDDGPVDYDESMALIRQMVDEGIVGAVCTSHVLDSLNSPVEREYTLKFYRLREMVEEARLPIELWLGSELYFYARIDLNSPLATLNNNGKYLLFEFPLNEIPKDAGELIFQWTMEGYIPILAHPERNREICQNPEILMTMIRRGVLMQMDAGSLLGQFGRDIKRAAMKMMEHRLIHFIASDYHHPEVKPVQVCKQAFNTVSEKWGEPYADLLFKHFPSNAVKGMAIRPPEPIPLKTRRKSRVQSIFEGR